MPQPPEKNEMINDAPADDQIKLADYAADPAFTPAVMELQAAASRIAPGLRERTVWMVNSTAQGGGVAEMLPRMVALLNELGVRTRWVVIGTDRPEFFIFTKRLHNLIHGEGDPQTVEEDGALYESVSRSLAAELRDRIHPEDILVVHDPQPLAMGAMLKAEIGVRAIWRCHIGTDERSETTRTVWRFLQRYAEPYDHAVFSAAEYIPHMLAGYTSIIVPGLDPLGHKNHDLSPHRLVGVLCNSGLKVQDQPLVTPPFEHQARRLAPDGRWVGVDATDAIGLLYRPVVTQISRWDRLKGFEPLLEGFVQLKDRRESLDGDPRHRRRLEILRLVLAGPDPGSVQDDPEAADVLEAIAARYRALSPHHQSDIAVLTLPMHSTKENALMVNAIQRCSTIIVQNSLREGFGLTATEAMWKNVPAIGTHACGLRQQIRNGIDGLLVHDPEDPDEIARRLDRILRDTTLRSILSRNARRRVFEEFLIFKQLKSWLQVLGQHATRPARASA
jgi:trehalose synthase